MSSLKMTFSLASLVLLIALGLIFAPTSVMAHLVEDDDPTTTAVPAGTGYIAGHGAGGTAADVAHPILDSVTLKGAAADGFVNSTTSFVVEFKFSGAAPTDFEVGDIDGGTATDFSGSGLVYTARLTASTTGDIGVTAGDVNAPGPLYVDVDNEKASAAIVVDNDLPALTTDTSEAKMQVVNGRRPAPPANGQWGPAAFDVEFSLTDAGSGLDAGSIKLTAAPAVLTFSNIGETATPGVYAATVSTKDVDIKAGTDVVITITFSDKAGNEASTPLSIPLAARTAGAVVDEEEGLSEDDTRNNVTDETTFPLSGTLAPDDFVVVAPMMRSDIDGTEIMIAELPNLQRFFARGGTISVVGGSGAAGAAPNKSVVISEMMWGLNLSAPEPIVTQANFQWIELYNTDNDLSDNDATTTPDAIDLTMYKLVFTPGEEVPEPAKLSDQVSNVDLVGWNVNIGQSGKIYTGDADTPPDTFVAVDLVSMYRNFKYADVTKVHNKDDDAKNRTGQLGVIPNGSAASGWAESTVNDTYAINQLGSPGAQHFKGRPATTATSATYGVVINEVGNNSQDSYDWIELLNTGTTEVDLKNWQITNITGDDTETALVTFPDNSNHKIPGGGILLVVNSDPYRDPDHPVAAGTIINSDKLREDKTGINSRYYVSSGLKLRDDGKMALLVRNAKDKVKQPTNVIDFTGPRPFNNIKNLTSKYKTDQWPLRAQGPGGGNVFQGDLAEVFASGSTYWRHKKNAGNADDTWRKSGYSGVGYKRGASGDGTPGYANGIVQENETKLATASPGATVTISEIMYDRGDRDNLPQWIELYNSSDTHAVNLDGWKLKIENADDVDVRSTVTIKNLGGTIIPPNQTVLIVAYTTGRVSRGSQGRDDFPLKRVINLSGKAELEIAEDATKRNYRLLSETAFQLTLIEKGGTAGVDTAGNLGADGTAMWALPMAEDGAGRSSIIRRYDKDVDNNGDPIGLAIDRDGTMIPPADGTGAWVLASTSDLSEVQVNETYYGSPDDVGTPGYRGGGALPVSLSKFRPERLDSGEIVVRWITESELNNAGFNILRSDARDGEFTKINTKLIAGQGTTSERTVYSFPDTSAKPNVVYYYQIQDVSLDGQVQTLRTTHLRGNVTAAGKLTTIWGELKALQ